MTDSTIVVDYYKGSVVLNGLDHTDSKRLVVTLSRPYRSIRVTSGSQIILLGTFTSLIPAKSSGFHWRNSSTQYILSHSLMAIVWWTASWICLPSEGQKLTVPRTPLRLQSISTTVRWLELTTGRMCRLYWEKSLAKSAWDVLDVPPCTKLIFPSHRMQYIPLGRFATTATKRRK